MNNRLSRPLIVLVAITAASLPAACSESEGSPPEPAEAAKGLARLETSSDTGDMWGQFYLGILKTYGKEDLPDSLGLVLSSAEHVGGPKRMYEGYRNALFAESLAPAPLDGIDLLKSSSSAGCGAASYALAVIHGIDPYDFWDAETSIENYREHLNLAHEQGLSTATGALGAHYVRGEHGYQRDVVRGRELLLSSYDQGDAWAAFALAHAYWNGLFGAVNKPRVL